MVAFIRQRKGRITFTAAVIAVIVVSYIAIRSTAPAKATSSGDPYVVPIAVDDNPDPNVFETTITAEAKTVDVGGGLMANVLTYNGTIPGPQINLKVGQTVIIHFKNNIAHPTGIHWHGIELNNASDGTPLTQNMVPPNGTFLYKFKVTRPGIYWYHPHHHSSMNQVFKGLYGIIVIKDTNEETLQASGVLPPESQTRTFALSDVTVCKATGNSSNAEGLCNTSPIDEDGNPRLPSPPGLGPFAPGDVPNIQKAGTAGTVREGEIVLLNGKNVGGRAGGPDDNPLGALDQNAETLNVLAGQGIRLRIGSEATVRFFRLRLTGSDGTNTVQVPLVRVGGQGGLLDHAVVEGGTVSGFNFDYDSGEVLLDPGDRVDVVAVFPPTATGVFTLWEKDFPRTGQGNAGIPTVPVAHFKINGSIGAGYTIANGTPLLTSIGASVEDLSGLPTGSLLDPSTFAPPKKGTSNPDIQLTNTGSSLGINSVIGEHDFPGDYTDAPRPFDQATMKSSARYAKLGDVLQLTVTNVTGAHHPFHLHGFSIQPISLTDTIPGAPPPPSGPDKSPGTGPSYTFPYKEFRDTVDIPGGYTLTFRVRLDDRTQMDGTSPGGGLGRWVFHCHIFFHASFGMISEFDVVDANGNERPYVNSNTDSVTVNEGQVASINGTYKDPDGDAITLSASLGTVTDNLNGTWSWSYTTKDGPDENQVVTVTITDAGNHTSQVAFQLNVNNLPPSASITSPVNGTLFQLADLIGVTAPFTDPGKGDTHTCEITWETGVTTAGVVAEVMGSGTCTGTHTYATGGLKTIIVKVLDDDGGSGTASVTIDVNSPPDCSTVTPNPDSLWPPNHKLALVTIGGATDPDGDTVTLTINNVTQDEPVNGQGDGDTAPDAFHVAGHADQVQLRSERSGNGNGRVYRILFGGNDGRGGTCSATVKTSVDKSKGAGPAIDSGLIFPSF